MAYAHSGPAWVEITGPFVAGEGDEALSYPANWPALATDDERAAAGVAVIVDDATTPPDGKTFQGFAAELADVAGVPHRVAVFIDTPAPSIPTEISMLQLELELNARSLTAAVLTAIAAAGAEADIYWRRANPVHRNHPLITTLQAALGWSDDLVDQIAASAIQRT